MASLFLVTDSNGVHLDARFTVQGQDILYHSRGGTEGKGAVNTNYSTALLLIIERLSKADVPILSAWVDSTTVQALPLADRVILSESEGSQSPAQVRRLMSNRMKSIRGESSSNTKGGSSTKRIRIATGFQGSSEGLADLVGGVPEDGGLRSHDRLPSETLRRATSEYIWAAVQEFMEGEVKHSFGPSTDFDLIADDGHRLPPKAVFGVALSAALGGISIGPKHFTAGESSTCFRLLREAGYQIIPKGELTTAEESQGDIDIGQEWSEGKAVLIFHFKRERAKGLARAKKAQYLRLHGKLGCEKCGLDPVAHYGTEFAEACIEVHHAATHVSQMSEIHKTSLADLQCLCANCHRLVHRTLAAHEGNATHTSQGAVSTGSQVVAGCAS